MLNMVVQKETADHGRVRVLCISMLYFISIMYTMWMELGDYSFPPVLSVLFFSRRLETLMVKTVACYNVLL